MVKSPHCINSSGNGLIRRPDNALQVIDCRCTYDSECPCDESTILIVFAQIPDQHGERRHAHLSKHITRLYGAAVGETITDECSPDEIDQGLDDGNRFWVERLDRSRGFDVSAAIGAPQVGDQTLRAYVGAHCLQAKE